LHSTWKIIKSQKSQKTRKTFIIFKNFHNSKKTPQNSQRLSYFSPLKITNFQPSSNFVKSARPFHEKNVVLFSLMRVTNKQPVICFVCRTRRARFTCSRNKRKFERISDKDWLSLRVPDSLVLADCTLIWVCFLWLVMFMGLVFRIWVRFRGLFDGQWYL
jgi:hypothetical protein